MLQSGVGLFYYNLEQACDTIGAAQLLQIGATIITNQDSFYKLGKNLLQIRQVLQISVIIQKLGHTKC